MRVAPRAWCSRRALEVLRIAGRRDVSSRLARLPRRKARLLLRIAGARGVPRPGHRVPDGLVRAAHRWSCQDSRQVLIPNISYWPFRREHAGRHRPVGPDGRRAGATAPTKLRHLRRLRPTSATESPHVVHAEPSDPEAFELPPGRADLLRIVTDDPHTNRHGELDSPHDVPASPGMAAAAGHRVVCPGSHRVVRSRQGCPRMTQQSPDLLADPHQVGEHLYFQTTPEGGGEKLREVRVQWARLR